MVELLYFAFPFLIVIFKSIHFLFKSFRDHSLCVNLQIVLRSHQDFLYNRLFAYRAMKIYDSSKVQWIGTSQIRKEHYEKRDEWFEKMG